VDAEPTIEFPLGEILSIYSPEGIKLKELSYQEFNPLKIPDNSYYLEKKAPHNLLYVKTKSSQLLIEYKLLKGVLQKETATSAELPSAVFKNEFDLLNLPQDYEEIYLQALYAKTTEYLINDGTDENYTPYVKTSKEALQSLIVATSPVLDIKFKLS
jgi:hypothetical protein